MSPIPLSGNLSECSNADFAWVIRTCMNPESAAYEEAWTLLFIFSMAHASRAIWSSGISKDFIKIILDDALRAIAEKLRLKLNRFGLNAAEASGSTRKQFEKWLWRLAKNAALNVLRDYNSSRRLINSPSKEDEDEDRESPDKKVKDPEPGPVETAEENEKKAKLALDLDDCAQEMRKRNPRAGDTVLKVAISMQTDPDTQLSDYAEEHKIVRETLWRWFQSLGACLELKGWDGKVRGGQVKGGKVP